MTRTDCKLCKALREISTEDRNALLLALSGTVNKTDIANVMTSNGYPMSEASVRRHVATHRISK